MLHKQMKQHGGEVKIALLFIRVVAVGAAVLKDRADMILPGGFFLGGQGRRERQEEQQGKRAEHSGNGAERVWQGYALVAVFSSGPGMRNFPVFTVVTKSTDHRFFYSRERVE